MFEKYRPNEKKCRLQNRFAFNFTIVWENLVKIDSLVTEIQNFAENIFSFIWYQFIRRMWPI